MTRTAWRTVVFGIVATLVVTIAGLHSTAPATATTMTSSQHGRFSATYVDPYRVYAAPDARLDAMFTAQRRVGITTAIVQWTGWIYDDGSVTTTYRASSATRFSTFDTVLPRLLESAKRHGITVWLGLGVRPSLFDEDATKASVPILNHDAGVDAALSRDLLAKFRGQFAGWYIPNEPGYQSVASTDVQRVETAYLRSITTALKKLPTKLPTMISPCVPRATEGGLSGPGYVQRLAPMIAGAGIDVWNLQDGHAMTQWTPQENLAMLQLGKQVAARAKATVWATLYTPGPGDPGTMTAAGLFADLDTIRAAGVPITTWTFDTAFNPDQTRSSAASRSSLYAEYSAHVRGATG